MTYWVRGCPTGPRETSAGLQPARLDRSGNRVFTRRKATTSIGLKPSYTSCPADDYSPRYTSCPADDFSSTAHSNTSCPADDFSSTAYNNNSLPADDFSSKAYSRLRQLHSIQLHHSIQHIAIPGVLQMTSAAQHNAIPAIQ